jgi:hypothetical protein
MHEILSWISAVIRVTSTCTLHRCLDVGTDVALFPGIGRKSQNADTAAAIIVPDKVDPTRSFDSCVPQPPPRAPEVSSVCLYDFFQEGQFKQMICNWGLGMSTLIILLNIL